MKTEELIKELEQLPINERMMVIERTVHSIRVQSEKRNMSQAANALAGEYEQNEDLTSFTALDMERFYEIR
jgi:hypothetical protein